MKYGKEINGKDSSTRLIFLVGMAWAMTSSTALTITLGWSAGEFIAVFTAQSAVFVGLKLGQKPMEEKQGEKT